VKRPPNRILIAVAALSTLTIAATACGGDDDETSPAATSPATAAPGTTATDAPATTAGSPEPTAPSTAGSTVSTAESSLGTILVDGDGNTLYMFMPDAQSASTCTGQCLGAWPALLGPATAGDGVDASLLGTAARPDDGTMQVTYNGWPLYYYALDAAAGDVNGQGVNDVWYVVDPSGSAIGAAASSGPSTTSDRYGY
jgi:predicted lipoprotein with Yx(FWY)xxD motif